MMRAALIASIVVAIVAAAVAAAGTQTRDTGIPQVGTVALSGTAVLSGVLMTDSPAPRPVRRATIRLSGAAGTSTRLVGTDDEGTFVFDALPASSFTVSATKPGFVETFYGSKHPGRGPGVPVAVAGGQHVKISLKILPGAVITGAITDSRGNPAPNVSVAIIGIGPQGASSAPTRGVTDDRGVYRIFGLAPGDYLVSAVPHLGTGAGGRGRASDITGVTDAEVQWARSASAAGRAAAPIPLTGRVVDYVPVYYPGTTDARAAAAVSVTAGEERSGIGLALQVVTTARIAGTLVDASGQAVTSATVSLVPRRRDPASPAEALVSSGALTLPRATVSATGFSIAGVAPGEYTIVGRSGSGGRSAAPPPGAVLWGATDLTVDGRDETDLVLHLLAAVKLSGTIVFEHSLLTPPDDMSTIDLSLEALGSASAPRAAVSPSGSFQFSSIVPGVYTFKATPPGAAAGSRWTLKSAMLHGRDLADGAFEIKPGDDGTGLVITLTDHAAEISGRLVDAGGVPITRYSIIVFPADRALWLPNARRIRSARPATDGTFTVAGLPAGDYAIAAAEDVDATDLADPAFLARLLASSYKVTLADGEKKRHDLRAGG
jgi:hypothetical protein